MYRAWSFLVVAGVALTACDKGGSSSSDKGGDDTGDGSQIEDCALLTTWADGKSPTTDRHVSPTGNDDTGDGSIASPYATIERAVSAIEPGTSIIVHQGTYTGGLVLQNLNGKAEAPIWLGGAPGEAVPVIDATGLNYGLRVSKAVNLVIHDLELFGATQAGLAIDDDNDTANFGIANHVIVQNVVVHDVTGDDSDCLRIMGIDHVRVLDSSFETCGGNSAGNGINFVGVRSGIVARSRVHDTAGNGIQIKGGSDDVEVRWSTVSKPGRRGVNLGGKTDLDRFRPPLDTTSENFEARNARVFASLIAGGRESVAFNGCVECTVGHNTIVEPKNTLLLVTQETFSDTQYTFAAPRDGLVVNNIFYFEAATVTAPWTVDSGLSGGTFQFSHNLWYAFDDPAASAPTLPNQETGQIAGQDPAFDERYAIDASSPAAGAGANLALVFADLTGHCYGDPPSIGAFEVP